MWTESVTITMMNECKEYERKGDEGKEMREKKPQMNVIKNI